MKKKSVRPKKPYQLAYTLADLLSFYPISEADAFAIAGVHRVTWQRWKKGEAKPPRATLELIRIRALGALPDPAFAGFTCHSGRIWDETNTGYTPGDIRSIPFFRASQAQYVQALKTIEAQKNRLLAFDQQPIKNLSKIG